MPADICSFKIILKNTFKECLMNTGKTVSISIFNRMKQVRLVIGYVVLKTSDLFCLYNKLLSCAVVINYYFWR